MHILIISFFIGLTLAIPVGPVTIAMSQRTLQFGALRGILLGAGASTADLLYMLILMLGMFHLFQHKLLLQAIASIGAGILCWFAYQAFTQKSEMSQAKALVEPLSHTYGKGFLIALLSPFGIIFWASMAAQISSLTHHVMRLSVLAMLGLSIGLMTWVIGLNMALHHTRHCLSEKAIARLNHLGGIALLLFALYSLWHMFSF